MCDFMRKDKTKKVVGIYAWEVSGIIRYVGHGHDIKGSRQGNHLSKMRHGKHTKKMQAFWDEVNDESQWKLVILEECSVHDLLIRESYWKDLYKDTIKNTNNINKFKKTFRTGHNAKKQKEKFSELFSGVKNPNCQNKIETVIAIKYLLENTDMRGRDIARLFDVNDEYVSKIKIKLRWKDVEVPDGYEFDINEFIANKNEIASTAMETISEENTFNTFIIPQIQIDKPVETFGEV